MHSTALRAAPAGDPLPGSTAPEESASASAKPLYYLDNFQRVLDWIGARYADLLSVEEAGFVDGFAGLPQPARALLVRMIMRKGTLFRTSKLNYAEIGCARAAAAPLLAIGWLESDPLVSIDSLFALCSKAEIGVLFAQLPARPMSKTAQLDALRQQCGQDQRFSAWLGSRADAFDPLLAVAVKPLCERLRLIFFGNFRQDWSELILSDMGVLRYEQVALSPASRGFRSRADVDRYIELQQAKEAFRAGAPPQDILPRLPQAPFDNDWLDSRRQRLQFQLAQQLEKNQDYAAALAAYTACRFPGARARSVRVLEKTRQFGAAQRLLKSALAAPESEAERQQLLRIAPRLCRQLGLPVTRAPSAPPTERIALSLPRPSDAAWVEGAVRDHLASAEAPVRYVENTLVNALFGLLCWDAIFSAIPGAFFHPYHRGPVDLYSADFVARRAAQFAACLAELDGDRWRATIAANYRAKQGIASPFVNWELLDAGLLQLALDCMAPQHLQRLFERMLGDLQANRSGFPDLIQFWPAERRYRMIEVKGPGDRLQDNQLRWLAYCAGHRLPVAVCYLQWQDAA